MEKKYKLPREFAEVWVSELRSGKYTKTTGDLFETQIEGKPECFCANGVGLLVWGIPRKELIFHSYVDRVLYISHPDIPKDLVDHLAKHNEWTLFDHIAKLNDQLNYTFPEIASWLETNVEFI